MEIVYDDAMLRDYIGRATEISPEHPVLVDRFLDDAIEIDVDALYDGTELYLGGVMEHIEEAGIHSGDSACALPPITLGRADIERIRASTEAIARGVGVRGLLNVQYALAADVLYVLEANPRASRTVPFVRRRPAVPLAKAAARVMLGATIAELRAEGLLPADRRRRRRCRSTRRSRSRRRCCRSAGSTRRRHRPRPGDALDRRGHGHRRARSARRSPSRRPAAYGGAADQGPRLRLGRQPRQAVDDLPGQAAGRPRLRDPRHRRAPPRCCAATASHGDGRAQALPGRGPTASRRRRS